MAAGRRFGSDRQLALRMFVVMFLLAALYLGFVAALWASGVDFFAIAIIAAALLGVQYYFSDRIVLWSMGAREVSAQEAPQLHDIVTRLCALAQLPKPRIALVDTAVPNAFATGRTPSVAVVAVTTGLMEKLDSEEVEAVLAHELSHVINRDVSVMTLASFFAVVAQLLMRSLWWSGMYGGRGRRDDRGNTLALVYLASLLVWVISFFLIRALSRYRELAADRGSALITGAPSHLAAALIKISGVVEQIPTRDLREVQNMNTLFIFPVLGGGALSELFSTHPSLDRRLEHLKRLQQDMERP